MVESEPAISLFSLERVLKHIIVKVNSFVLNCDSVCASQSSQQFRPLCMKEQILYSDRFDQKTTQI